MAYGDRYSDRERGRGRWRDEDRRAEWDERETRWQSGDSFGAGWGNQTPDYGPRDRNDGPPYGGRSYRDDWGSGIRSGGPGFAPDFAGQRFGRSEFGRSRNVGYLSRSSGYGFRGGYDDRDHGDPHYSEWRDQQIAALDRDYDDYRRENQSRFDREFGAWRSRRGQQREALDRVTEHMEVVGSDGGHVGKVDKIRGDSIILAKNDEDSGGVHHSVPCGWVEEVGDKVTLNLSADDAKERWRTESRNRALFEREDSGSRGPHMLNRAFSGTYPDER